MATTEREQARGIPRFRRSAVIIALVLGLGGFVAAAAGLTIALLPRDFTASQQQQITAWQVSGRWRAMPAGQIFPGSVGYTLPATVIQDNPPLELHADRVAIARASGCTEVTDVVAGDVLRRDGCEAVLRATYVDQTGSFVVTVGVAVLPTPAAAAAAAGHLSAPALAAVRSNGQLPPGVRIVRFSGAASGLYDYTRQLTATQTAGPYVVMYAAGYSDGRPHVDLAHDAYSQAELSSMAQGVAGSVASGLGKQPPPPHCPGSPGC